jgi:Fe2+ or Zn2+ uptake regulation protein
MSGIVETALADALRSRGGRVTPQRLAIARIIGERDAHVTAEEIFGAVTERLPGVSMPTVYATLELLEELGHIARVPTGSGPVLFDTRADQHDHMICRGCGDVIDLDAPINRRRLFAAASSHGFSAECAQVVVQGLCATCAATNQR